MRHLQWSIVRDFFWPRMNADETRILLNRQIF